MTATATDAPIWSSRITVAGKPGLVVGAVVTYHGSKRSEHGFEFVITSTARGLFTVFNRDYPDSGMSGVRPTSLRPTGEVVKVCRCGHEAGPFQHGQPAGSRLCRGRCGCRRHREK